MTIISDYSMGEHLRFVEREHFKDEVQLGEHSNLVAQHAQTFAVEISHQAKFTQLFSLDNKNAHRAELPAFEGTASYLFQSPNAHNNTIVNSAKIMEVKTQSKEQKQKQQILNDAFSVMHQMERQFREIQARMGSIRQA